MTVPPYLRQYLAVLMSYLLLPPLIPMILLNDGIDHSTQSIYVI